MATSSFSDVDASAWYKVYVATGEKEAILAGYDDGTMRPNAPITRAEMLKLLLQAMGVSMAHPQASPFLDVTDEDWFKTVVDSAHILGLIQGRSTDSFAPNEPMTRGEAAVLTVRAFAVTDGY